MIKYLKGRARQIAYLALILIGAVFVLLYRGSLWPFVRSYVGDWLVVQFIYVIARFAIGFRWRYRLTIGIFLFALAVEVIQYLAASLIPHTFAAEITIGSTFDALDIAAYALGLLTVLLTECFWKP